MIDDTPPAPDDGAREREDPTPIADGLPWIDVHNHAHTLSWADRERYALSGCRGMVTVASGTHWMPGGPVRPAQYRFLWEHALDRQPIIERQHGVPMRVAVGIQTGKRLQETEALLEAMAGYLDREAVVAVGETGIRPTQQGEPWPVEGQRAVLEAQMALAADHDVPVILHTPSALRVPEGDGADIHGYEVDRGSVGTPVLDGEDANLEAVRRDVEAAHEAGLPEARLVASHADADNLAYLLEETSCFVSLTLGNSWLTGVDVDTVASTIETYGPDRIMLETDAANVMRSDVLAVKRAAHELVRRGFDEATVRQIALDNARAVFDLDAA